MSSSQTTLPNLKPEYCEHSKPHDEIFICDLTSFGFVFRCLKSDKTGCPDLEYFLEEKRKRERKK